MKITHLITICTIIFACTLACATPTIIVAVIDTGISPSTIRTPLCPGGHRDFSGANSLLDISTVKHGSKVAQIIAQEAGQVGYCLLIIKIYKSGPNAGLGKFDLNIYIKALEYVARVKPAILNLSMSGEIPDERETVAIKRILNNGTVIVAAAGNEGKHFGPDSCTNFPACVDPRIFVVGSFDASSNWGDQVDIKLDGHYNDIDGTSMSAARFTGRAVRKALNIGGF